MAIYRKRLGEGEEVTIDWSRILQNSPPPIAASAPIQFNWRQDAATGLWYNGTPYTRQPTAEEIAAYMVYFPTNTAGEGGGSTIPEGTPAYSAVDPAGFGPSFAAWYDAQKGPGAYAQSVAQFLSYSQNNQIADLERIYGKFPTDPAAQELWFRRMNEGAGYTVQQQSRIAEQTGWQGFLNEGLPVLLASGLIGAMVAPLAAAQGFTYGPVGMVSDVVGAEFPGLLAETIPTSDAGAAAVEAGATGWENDFATGWENAAAETANQNMALAEVSGQVPSGTLAATVGDAAAQPYLQAASEILATSNPETVATNWEDDFASSWEQAQAETANQNAALAEVTGQVPSGTLANTIGTDAANKYLDAAQAIVNAGNPLTINTATTENVERVTVTGQKPPADEIAYQYSPTDIVAIDTGPGGAPVITGGSGGGYTGDSWPSIQTVGAGLTALATGASLVRQLTASDASREIPMTYQPGSNLPPDQTGNTLPGAASNSFPWWVLIAGAIALTGN